MAKAVFLRPAEPGNATALTALALWSKAYWGYDDAFMKACIAELTITPERVATEDMTIAEADGVIAGWYHLLQVRVKMRGSWKSCLWTHPLSARGWVCA